MITSRTLRNSTEHTETKDNSESKLQIENLCSFGIFNILEVIAETGLKLELRQK